MNDHAGVIVQNDAFTDVPEFKEMVLAEYSGRQLLHTAKYLKD
jgi:hypothetical protein